jgi:YbgC/YbaW family acyl-CoA thioester hydrolase
VPALETRCRLRFYDLDRAGMVFHGAYARLFQDAFEDLMREAGFVERDLEQELGVRVPVVDHRMRFPGPPEGHELDLVVWVEELGETSATFGLAAREDGRAVAEATVTRVCVDAEGEATPIPAPLREAWARFREDA